MNRRRFVLAGMAALAVPRLTLANTGREVAPVRELRFLNLHTGEKLRAPYWENGSYQTDALSAIARVLRDHRSNDVHPIDVRLLDLVHRLTEKLDHHRPVHVISGYRSPASNKMLRRNSGGVARKSFHMSGKAIDLRLEGVPLRRLHKAALAMRGGGVGYYGKSRFVHLDTGRVRRW
jgi:uncharacterized protein YcbK (DUF882 family)